MNSHAPLVSVCMPVYRSERYIAQAIQSVLDQTLADFEVIVVDDASPDKTFEIAQSIRDSRLRIFRNDANLGPEKNWNRAKDLAKGRYIKVLPGDDTLYPTCLERQAEILDAACNQDVVLTYCPRDITDGAGRKALTARFPGHGRIMGTSLVRKTIRCGTNIIGEPGAVLFRADAARRTGDFDASLGFVTDLDYWLRLLKFGHGHALAEPLCTFRISGENWSIALGRNRYLQFIQFLDRLALADDRLSRFDVLTGKAMARINETLRRFVYRRLIGLSGKEI